MDKISGSLLVLILISVIMTPVMAWGSGSSNCRAMETAKV